MVIFIKHLQGSKTDLVESFEAEHIRIGRHADNDLKFDPQKDTSVSGYHAEIYRDGNRFVIKDLQSTNGTFINSRKLDKPTALKEGDEIQFSSRGPKVIFTTKDPAAGVEPDVPASKDAPTEFFSAEAVQAETAAKKNSLGWEKLKPFVPVVAAGVVLATLLAAGLFLFKISWWLLLIVGAGTVLVAGSGYLAWRWFKRRKTIRERAESGRAERETSAGRGNKDNLQDLRKKWDDVLRSLKQSKLQRSGEDPIYALPWFLAIGEPGCGKSTLIKAGGPLSSVVSQGADVSTQNCDWWFFNSLVVLDISGRYVYQSKDSDAQGEWQTLLGQIRANRRNEPLNGVMVTLSADVIASRPLDKLKEQATQLRERLDEMTQILGIKFPVFLVLSKVDLIPGFNEFFDDLPETARGQTVGHVNADALNNSSDTPRFFDRALRSIADRLAHIRLAVLSEAERAESSRGMFLFPAEFKSLHGPLKSMIEILFRPSPYRDAPLCGGLFLTSARQTSGPISRLAHLLEASYKPGTGGQSNRDIFVRDLFATILPNNRSLVNHTNLSHERRHIVRAATVILTLGAGLLLCGLLTLSFRNNRAALADLAIASCSGVEKNAGSILRSLRATDECRQVIEAYVPTTVWQKIGMNFGLGQWRRVSAALQERFAAAFTATVLSPLDGTIDKSLTSGSGSPLLLGAIFQRMRFLSQCQEDGKCSFSENGSEANYAVLLSTMDPQVKEGHAAVALFQRDYRSFLQWQKDENSYERMRSKDRERIEGWLRSGGLSKEGVLNSANEFFSAVRAVDFWDVPGGIQVEGAYTLNAWMKGIEPLVSALKQVASEKPENAKFDDDVKEFETKYKRETLQKWGEFLSRFVDTQPRTAAAPRRLALTLIGSKSPYDTVLRSAHQNINGILGNSVSDQEKPAWAILLKSYAELKDKLDKPKKDEKAPTHDEALAYLATYLEALKQVPAKLSTPQDSFVAAQGAFREGEAAGKPTQPILQAMWSIKMLKSTERFKYPDPTFWVYLERPVEVAWRSMLDEAATHLQQQWREVYLAASGEDVAPGLKAAKVMEFVNGQAVGFLKPQRGGFQPNAIQGQGISFTPQFIALISTLGPDSLSGAAKLPPTIVRN